MRMRAGATTKAVRLGRIKYGEDIRLSEERGPAEKEGGRVYVHMEWERSSV